MQMQEQPRSIYLGKQPKGVVLHKIEKQSRNKIKNTSGDPLLESSRSQVFTSLLFLLSFRTITAIQVSN